MLLRSIVPGLLRAFARCFPAGFHPSFKHLQAAGLGAELSTESAI
jgi:hypothetical protein